LHQFFFESFWEKTIKRSSVDNLPEDQSKMARVVCRTELQEKEGIRNQGQSLTFHQKMTDIKSPSSFFDSCRMAEGVHQVPSSSSPKQSKNNL
jgi:hypothetical protein